MQTENHKTTLYIATNSNHHMMFTDEASFTSNSATIFDVTTLCTSIISAVSKHIIHIAHRVVFS